MGSVSLIKRPRGRAGGQGRRRAACRDGLLPVRLAPERLGVSLSLIHIWIQHGVLTSDQRTSVSKRWVRLTEADVIRLDGQHDWHRFPTINRAMSKEQWTRDLVWDAVRDGTYVAYRHRAGRHTQMAPPPASPNAMMVHASRSSHFDPHQRHAVPGVGDGTRQYG